MGVYTDSHRLTSPLPAAERRARVEQALADVHVPPPYGDSAVLASLLSRILDVEPSWVRFDGTLATHGGVSFRAKLDTYHGTYSLHVVGRCPHCGTRGHGPAIGSWGDLERCIDGFRLEFHPVGACVGVAR